MRVIAATKAPDVICLTETWLSSDIENNILHIDDFSLIRSDREGRRGGGTAIYVRDKFTFREVSCNQTLFAEGNGTFVDLQSVNMSILCLYIPPNLCTASNDMIRENINKIIDNHLTKLPNRQIMILGDFNNFNINGLTSDLALIDIVEKPTRGLNILDHVLISSCLESIYSPSQVSYEAFINKSDHLTLIVEPANYEEDVQQTRQHVVYDYRQSNLNNLESMAQSIPWSDIVKPADDVDRQWKCLFSCLLDLLHTTIPQKKVYLTSRDKCWMTPITKMLINEKWRAFRAKDWRKFNNLKDKLKNEIVKAKSLWSNKLKQSPNGMWRMTAYLSGKGKKNTLEPLIREFNTPEELANNIGYRITHKDLPHPIQTCWEDDNWNVTFTESEVKTSLFSLASGKAAGPDGVPNRVYSLLAPFIAKPLKTIFDSSVRQRKFPSGWKSAIIVPIPKTAPPHIEKLRTISILPTPSKVFERCILKKIRQDCENITGENQHAFRKAHSTTTAVVDIYDMLTRLFDDQSVTRFSVLSLDFSKAFDMVDHNKLISKAFQCGLSTGFLSWLKSYLSNRSFQVKVQGRLSPSFSLNCGVPQGSVLGPILFAILVNDLPGIETSWVTQYADDANIILHSKDRDPEHLHRQISNQMKVIKEWCVENRQELNVEKSKLLVIARNPLEKFERADVKVVDSLKILGVHINKKLNWNTHIDALYRKASQRLHILRMLKQYTDRDELHAIYCALIRSVFEYCSPAFIHLNKKLTARIRRIEKRAHWLIFGDAIRTCSCKLDGLTTRREDLGCKFFQSITSNTLHNLHKRLPTPLPHNKRFSSFLCRTTTRQNSFLPYITIIHNMST